MNLIDVFGQVLSVHRLRKGYYCEANAFILVTIQIVCYIWFELLPSPTLHKKEPELETFLSYLSSVLLCCTTSVCLMTSSLGQVDSYIRLHQDIYKLRRKLNVVKTPLCKYTIITCILFICTSLHTVAVSVPTIFLYRFLGICTINVTTWICSRTINNIASCCEQLSKKIEAITETISLYNAGLTSRTLDMDVRNLMTCYKNIMDLIHNIGEVYGAFITFLLASIVVFSTTGVMRGLKLGIFLQGKSYWENISVGLLNANQSISIFILGVAIVSACSNVKKKLKEISLTTFQMLAFLPLRGNTHFEDEIHDDVLTFDEMVLKRADFKIAGFFVLDKPVVFAMLGSVTSYVLICLGLDKNFQLLTQSNANDTQLLNY